MSAFLLTPPATEPLTLAEAKQFLRVEHTEDDAMIVSLIVAARTQVETMARSALIAQTWRFVRDAWPQDGRIALKRGPLISVQAARVLDGERASIDIDPETFVLDKASWSLAAPAWTLPIPGRRIAAIELDVVLGFGTTETSVPEPLRQAVRQLTAHWYDNRGLMQGVAAILPGLWPLIAPYRALSL
ncbi:hypothetical protein X566_15605 [Afipia sp. P52-10]|jgi:uncharacterized phiE125 gp8 family phage protein|uniref:head-tail connector protein n=1 Tax=Afipia sp. P52-10 TaxID=1429916 RepID=UPI0003DF05E7|nr:head-tail connector protein [Afipia sp. P52-10]ETR76017.1 hypothetical protein X566_15605 [Afipia sp. P52-10]